MLAILLITSLVVITLERTRLARRRSPLARRGALTDVGFLVVSWIALAKLTFVWVAWATGAVASEALAGVPLWAETLLVLVLLDVGNYAAHWLLHRYEPLWHIHAVHHSSPMLDALATFRSHVLEQALRRIVAPLLLILLGASPAAVAIASAVFLAWGIMNHANLALELRLLEPVFITPRLHLLHHVAESSEHNLGTLFSVWDRLLGRLSLHDVARDTPLGNGHAGYPQTFAALLAEPFRGTPRAQGEVRVEAVEHG